MKIRIKGNSVRYRLTQVAVQAKRGRLFQRPFVARDDFSRGTQVGGTVLLHVQVQ